MVLYTVNANICDFQNRSSWSVPRLCGSAFLIHLPTESVIDSILHPELRDRMILLRGKIYVTCEARISLLIRILSLGRFDLVDCLHDYRTAITIHGDDVLAHNNWEISETWLLRYKYRPLLLAATFSN